MSILDAFGAATTRPGAIPEPAPREPRPAPQVNACDLAYAARAAALEVLPAEWQKLPDGQYTANALAGMLANHYADRQTQHRQEEEPC